MIQANTVMVGLFQQVYMKEYQITELLFVNFLLGHYQVVQDMLHHPYWFTFNI